MKTDKIRQKIKQVLNKNQDLNTNKANNEGLEDKQQHTSAGWDWLIGRRLETGQGCRDWYMTGVKAVEKH